MRLRKRAMCATLYEKWGKRACSNGTVWISKDGEGTFGSSPVWRVEIIVCSVCDTHFLAGCRSIAGFGLRRYAALGVDSLDIRHPAEDPFAAVTRCAQQQPRYGPRLRCVLLRHNFSLHFASIHVPPGRPRGMLNYLLPCRVQQFGLRSLEHPGVLFIGALLANIDFLSFRVRHQNYLLA